MAAASEEEKAAATTTASTEFGYKTTATEVLKGVDLSGKTILVTGTSSGLGLRSTLHLARAGATVLCLIRDVSKMEAALDKKDSDLPLTAEQRARLKMFAVDLSDLESVVACGKEVVKAHPTINGVICNAGVMFPAGDYPTTKQGHETHHGVNFLSHFALVHVLQPALKGKGRVVVVSSMAMRWAGSPPTVNWEDPSFAKSRDKYSKMLAYAQSSLTRSIFAVELERRFAKAAADGGDDAPVWHAYSLHPGVIMTGLQRDFTDKDKRDLHLVDEDGKPNPHVPLKSEDQGCATSLFALTHPSLDEHGGAYLCDCKVSAAYEGKADDFTGYSPEIKDEESGKRLWELATKAIEPFVGSSESTSASA